MWYRLDFSAILGGIVGFIIMFIVVAVFSDPLAIKQLIAPFLQ